jgi:hypothetical protein
MTLSELMGSKLGQPADKTEKPKKHKLHMTISPLDDNRFHVQHDYRGGNTQEPTPERGEYAPANVRELVAHIGNHYGLPKEASEPKEETPPAPAKE